MVETSPKIPHRNAVCPFPTELSKELYCGLVKTRARSGHDKPCSWFASKNNVKSKTEVH